MTGKADGLMNKNLYEMLGILQTATSKEIKTAYRKKALECHPDKNPDDPKAAELFHELTRILEILIDEAARAAYDKILTARIAAKLRNDVLDSKRKKLKEELEERERQSREQNDWQSYYDKFEAEMKRLRKESSKQVEREMNLIKELISRRKKKIKEALLKDLEENNVYRLKVRWTISKDGQKDVSYDYDKLSRIFSKYGSVNEIVVSSKKKGSALIEYSNAKAALNASKLEKGFPQNPLNISWIGKPPYEDNHQMKYNFSSANNIPENERNTEDDFEKMVLQKLKDAESKKKPNV